MRPINPQVTPVSEQVEVLLERNFLNGFTIAAGIFFFVDGIVTLATGNTPLGFIMLVAGAATAIVGGLRRSDLYIEEYFLIDAIAYEFHDYDFIDEEDEYEIEPEADYPTTPDTNLDCDTNVGHYHDDAFHNLMDYKEYPSEAEYEIVDK